MESGFIKDSKIFDDLNKIKAIISTTKHSNLNDELSEGYALIQELPIRFCTTHEAVLRFIKSASRLSHLPLSNSGDAMEKISKLMNSLNNITIAHGSVSYPALEAIKFSFSPIIHARPDDYESPA